MKIIGISGSPRSGNTEWMLRKFLEEIAGNGVDTELIYLRNLEIKGCDGCYSCEVIGKVQKGTCRIQDNMQQIYPKLLEANGLVLGTPVYCGLLSGLLKNFMDRTCPICPSLKGKPIVGIVVAEEVFGKTVENLKTYSSSSGMRWIGHVTALGKTPRVVSRDKELKLRLKQLAKKLINAL